MWKLIALVAAVGLTAACKTNSHKPTFVTRAAWMNMFPVGEDLSATSTNSVEGPRLIGPGMQLTIRVEQDPSLARQMIVSPSGLVEFPGVGRINSGGLTADELGDKIRAALEKDFFKKATVNVSVDSTPTPPAGATTAGIVNVMGAVTKPGPIPVPVGVEFSVVNAILTAGGFGQFAKGEDVQVFRLDKNGKKVGTRINVERIMKQGEFERDIPLRNGDWVIVPEKWISF